MRDDLCALTPEAIASLSNVGLVKRAQKELDGGKGPTLTERDDGAVVATFPDGVVATLPRNTSLKDAPCTCGAPGACRHKVAVALAYRAWITPAAGLPPAAVSWNPAEVDDVALESALGKRTLEDARAQRRRGFVVELRHDAPATARLPACTVRFLVPRDLAYARCDCQAGQDCVHIALAVWAFQRAAGQDRTVDVREATANSSDVTALTSARELARTLVIEGTSNAGTALTQKFAVAREHATVEGFVWPSLLLEALEAQVTAYQARSARYHPAESARLVTEIEARARAVERGGELPVRHVLGQGEASETKLDLLRLISLGARVDADGPTRIARVLLADPDTATVLVAEKLWSFHEGEAPLDGPALTTRRFAASTTLGILARGQVVTRVAKRRANRAVAFGAATGGALSVTPHNGDYSALPSPVRAAGVEALLASMRSRPPRALRPRLLTEDVHVLAVASIPAVAWDAGSQRLVAQALDTAGRPFQIVRAHRAVTPHAIDALGAALGGAWGPVRYVAGEVQMRGGGLSLNPTSVSCDRVVVPDLEDAPDRHPLMTARPADLDDNVAQLHAGATLLEEALHLGLRGVANTWPERARQAADHLDAQGLASTGLRLRRVADALREARSGSPDGWPAAANTWLEAALRFEVALELA